MSKQTNEAVFRVDLDRFANNLELGIGAAARLGGVSTRQLSYWTDKGIIKPINSDGTRFYNRSAIEKAILIKQGLDLGYSLEGATAEVEAYLARREVERQALEQMSTEDLRLMVNAQVDRIGRLADRIRRGLRTYRVSGDLGRMAASLTGVEGLIAFFEEHPYATYTVKQVATHVRRDASEVGREITLLAERGFLLKIGYPGADVYRHLPGARLRPVQSARQSAQTARAAIASSRQARPAAQARSASDTRETVGTSAELVVVWTGHEFCQGIEGLCAILSGLNSAAKLDLGIVKMRMDENRGLYEGRSCIFCLLREIADQYLLSGSSAIELFIRKNYVECRFQEGYRFSVAMDLAKLFSMSFAVLPELAANLEVGKLVSTASANGWRKRE
ncbi:MAG: MerR family transcriptional regulator [Candidatus Berkelbacteria bacterium]|nr:MerR family transcriptional regulator [Candidatus Berkelbacteria bacterium]